jgi:glycosyltransferase involved in cell wall biosynthesis
MKIIVAVPDITFNGGAEQVARDIGAALLELGEVVIVSAFSHARDRGASDTYECRSGGRVAVAHLGMGRPRNALDKIMLRLTLMSKVMRAVPDADIVIGNNFFRYFALRPLSMRPVCVEVQHLCYEEERPRRVQLSMRNALYKRLHNVVVLTERDRALFARHGVKNTSVLYNAVHLPQAVGDPIARPKVVVAVGRLTPQKNFAALIEVWADVATRLADWSLVIYGEGEQRDMLQALIEAKGLTRRVTLAGFRGDKREIYESGSLLCSVSRYEGFPLSLCEAAAYGLPVVAFDCPSGPRELLSMGDLGRLVTLDDKAGLARALVELAEDEALRLRCSRNARLAARVFAFDAFAFRWRQHVERLVRERVSPNQFSIDNPTRGQPMSSPAKPQLGAMHAADSPSATGGKSTIRATTHGLLRRVKHMLPDELYLYIWHRWKVGRFPNLKNPKTFNEWILHRNLNPHPRWTELADKLAVRDYVRNKIGEKHLVPLLAAPAVFTREVFDALPNSFAMKANHGCGFVKLVRDKSSTSFEELNRIAQTWLATDYYLVTRERHYHAIERRIYFEKLLLDRAGRVPADIKLNMFGSSPDGPIIYAGVVSDRSGDTRIAMFDAQWNRLDLALGEYRPNEVSVPPPANWEEIKRIAMALAEDLGYVRVDLYAPDNEVYFGELTFTPGAGVFPFHPDRFDHDWGRLLKEMMTRHPMSGMRARFGST